MLGRLLLQVGLHRNRIYSLRLKIIFNSESIADYSQRPLYSLEEIEMNHGHGNDSLERRLDSELARASKWGAVVLMDEADVVMWKKVQMSILETNKSQVSITVSRPAIEWTPRSPARNREHRSRSLRSRGERQASCASGRYVPGSAISEYV